MGLDHPFPKSVFTFLRSSLIYYPTFTIPASFFRAVGNRQWAVVAQAF